MINNIILMYVGSENTLRHDYFWHKYSLVSMLYSY